MTIESDLVDVAPDADVYRCFVIGPIGSRLDPIGTPGREAYEDAIEVFERVIVPACQAFGIEPVRADQIAISGAVTEQVLRHIYEDEIVIADVSGGNPNVMYELGLRHTRPLLTIQVGEYGQLPFDIADIRTIQFSRSERGLIDARKSLENALSAGIGATVDPIAVARIWTLQNDLLNEDTSRGVQAEPTGPADLAGPDDTGFLERIEAVESLFPEITGTSTEIGALLQTLGATATESTAELETANAAGLNARERLNIVAKFARRLQTPADDLLRLTTQFYDQMESANEQIGGIFRFLERNPTMTAQPGTEEFLDGISTLARSVRESMEHVTGFGGAVGGLAEMSSTLKRPASQIVSAVKRMAETSIFADEWESIAHRLRRKSGTDLSADSRD